MRMASAAATCGLALCLAVAPAQAWGGGDQEARPGARASQHRAGGGGATVEGRVAGIDPGRRTLTLEDGSTIRLGQGTEVVKDGDEASLSEIVPGDDVRASYAGGHARKVSVHSDGASDPAAAPGE